MVIKVPTFKHAAALKLGGSYFHCCSQSVASLSFLTIALVVACLFLSDRRGPWMWRRTFSQWLISCKPRGYLSATPSRWDPVDGLDDGARELGSAEQAIAHSIKSMCTNRTGLPCHSKVALLDMHSLTLVTQWLVLTPIRAASVPSTYTHSVHPLRLPTTASAVNGVTPSESPYPAHFAFPNCSRS
jgi:hypothetical protein